MVGNLTEQLFKSSLVIGQQLLLGFVYFDGADDNVFKGGEEQLKIMLDLRCVCFDVCFDLMGGWQCFVASDVLLD